MSPRLNHELFSAKATIPPAARVALGVAAIAVLVAAVWLNWSRLTQSDEERYQAAYDNADYAAALEVALGMAEDDPDSARAFQAVAAAYIQLAVHSQDPEALLASALDAALSAEALDRVNPDTQRIIGYILELQGKTQEAVSRYQEALKADPNDSATLSQLAAALEKGGNRDSARRYYQAAVTADPQNEQSRVLYARFLLGDGSYELAASQASAVLSSEKRSFAAEAARILAAVRTAEGEPGQALAMAEQAVALDPSSARAMITLGEAKLAALFAGGDMGFDQTMAEARALADRAIAADPSLALGYLLAFKAAHSQGDREAADAYGKRALEVATGDSSLSPEQREAVRLYIVTVPTVRITNTTAN